MTDCPICQEHARQLAALGIERPALDGYHKRHGRVDG